MFEEQRGGCVAALDGVRWEMHKAWRMKGLSCQGRSCILILRVM